MYRLVTMHSVTDGRSDRQTDDIIMTIACRITWSTID